MNPVRFTFLKNTPQLKSSKALYIGWRMWRKIPLVINFAVFSNPNSFASATSELRLPARRNVSTPAHSRYIEHMNNVVDNIWCNDSNS